MGIQNPRNFKTLCYYSSSPMHINLIYGSNTGHAGEIAQLIGDTITQDVRVINAKEARKEDLACDYLIIGGATHANGRIQKDLQAFFDSCGYPLPIKAKEAAIFGVGDSISFKKTFNWILPQLRMRLEDSQTPVWDTYLAVDGKIEFYKEGIVTWAKKLRSHIQEIAN